MSILEKMSQSPLELRRILESDPQHCAGVIRDLLKMLDARGWSKDDVFAIQMAVEEAVMNAIKHGNHEDPEKSVSVFVEVTENRFYAKITDEGPGFCPDDVPDPTLEANLEKVSGRGVMLIKTFVDECRYNKCGNSVELVKHKADK